MVRGKELKARPSVGAYTRILMVVWSLVVAGALLWGLRIVRNNALVVTRDQARAMFTNIVTFRKWNAQHGGVYAPISVTNKPNKYLKDEPERDIVTESGKRLTLINPAYMTKQVEKLMGEGKLDYRAHITSLKPINPDNKPDPWDRKALLKLNKGDTKVSAVQTISGAQYMRVMFPLRTDEHCIKCHAEKGYKVGDLRGGISIAVPMAFVAPVTQRGNRDLILVSVVAWVLGLITLLVGGKKQLQTEMSLRISEESLYRAQEIAHLGNWDWDIIENRLFWSDEIYRMFGVSKGEFTPTYDAFLEFVHPEDREYVEEAVKESLDGKPYNIDHRIVEPTGQIRVVQQIGELFRNDKGKPVRMIGTVLDVTERTKAEEKIEYMAYHDVLTGLPNRRWLEKKLVEAKADSNGNKGLAIIFVELIECKNIKNTLGSDVVNKLIQRISSELPESKRASRTIARIGDDELIVVLEKADKISTTEYVEKLMSFFRKPISVNKNLITVVANIGIALFPEDGEGVKTLLRNSDTAMSYAKKAGPYHYRFYADGMGSFRYQARKQILIASRLSQALEQNRFVLFYQPIVNLENEAIVGTEALIRRQTSNGKLVMPTDFICVAEKTGQIIPISDWVLSSVCAQAGKWQSSGFAPIKFNINLSAVQFREPDLIWKLHDLFNKTELDPGLFELEITEGEIMRSPKASAETIKAMRNMGISVAVDDFGTGYSSLSYLKELPVDVIKIDKSFVEDINFNSESLAIVKAIIEIGHALDMTLLAEGVETIEQKLYLQDLGCDLAQGFLFNKPLPADQFEQLLSKESQATTKLRF
jgi:diguanylate cyclase (GGDEF)-like protein/PAS domain S-box-containing protein